MDRDSSLLVGDLYRWVTHEMMVSMLFMVFMHRHEHAWISIVAFKQEYFLFYDDMMLQVIKFSFAYDACCHNSHDEWTLTHVWSNWWTEVNYKTCI